MQQQVLLWNASELSFGVRHCSTGVSTHCRLYTLTADTLVCGLLLLRAAASALQALQARRDTLQKRTDSLIRLKNEFQELSRVL
jgi:hypothetical protein